ncbi:hypothetical protein CR513_07298, partial [Mucuna pruriens]
MARFLHGLNREIQDIVELHDYTSLSILVHHATKVELQLKRYGRISYPSTSSSWKGKERREDKLRRDKSPKKESKVHIVSQCPNKRTMILRENEEVESESSQEESTSSESKFSSEEAPYEGDLLMVRRLMSTLRLVEKLSIPVLPHPKPYKL